VCGARETTEGTLTPRTIFLARMAIVIVFKYTGRQKQLRPIHRGLAYLHYQADRVRESDNIADQAEKAASHGRQGLRHERSGAVLLWLLGPGAVRVAAPGPKQLNQLGKAG
jgi:hypothetical protein